VKRTGTRSRRLALLLLALGLLGATGLTVGGAFADGGPLAFLEDLLGIATDTEPQVGGGDRETGADEPAGDRHERNHVTPVATHTPTAVTSGPEQNPARPAATAAAPVKQLDLAATLAGLTLHAALERDAATGEDPQEVTPGPAPEMTLASFVAGGHETLEQAAELVGERRPHLEEGVPVSLSGVVVSRETGRPIAGATVLATSTFYVRRFFYDHHLREVARVLTDAEGRYDIERLNADPAHFGEGGRVVVTVTADGHAPAQAVPLDGVTPGYRNRLEDVVLTAKTHSLRGRVTDHWENAPVAGATVYATGSVNPVTYPKDQRDALFLVAPRTVTDAEGSFELAGLGAGAQIVSVHAGDDCIGNQSFLVPAVTIVHLRTHPIHGRVEGRVLDADDEPVSLAVVRGGFNSTHSFADGGFVLENFRGDVVELAVDHPDYRRARLAGVTDGSTDVVVRLERRVPLIRLRVRDRDTDEPVERLVLTLVAVGEGSVRTTASPQFIAQGGLYELRLPEGVARIEITSPAGHAPESVPATGLRDGDEVEVLLQRSE